VINVIHVNSPLPADETSIDAELEGDWEAFVGNLIPNIFTWQDVTYTRLDGTASVVIPWTAAQPSNSGQSAPMNAAACVGWRTSLAGRSHRGRSYIGPLSANMADATHPDLLSSTPLAALSAQSATFISDMSSGGFPLLVASYKLGVATVVSRAVVNPKICSQRKRTNGR
jgi:hypothetical protein